MFVTINKLLNLIMNGRNLPIVAIVGQPNAGKSTLLNKIAGRPLAVTSELAGTTRDRQYVDTNWSGTNFTLVDTAGLSLDATEGLELSLLKQIEVALSEADVVMLVVDGKEPKAAVASNTLQKFRKIKKTLLLVVNKLDSPKTAEEKLAEFRSLGIKPLFGVSSISGRGIGDMLDYITDAVRERSSPVEDEGLDEGNPRDGIAVAIVGKPNVGKSSIFNSILKQERVVVSPIPGTTRTAIDENITVDGVNYTFIDTAGLKKKEFRQAEADVFSGFQTFKSIRRSDVCFLVIDATQEITKQDQRVASEIFAMGKGCIILANKCDLLTADSKTGKNTKSISKNSDDQYQTVRDYISHHFPFLWMCPLFFVSALTSQGLEEAVNAIKPIFDARHKKITDEVLKDFLKKKMKQNPPKLLRDQKTPKVMGLKQVEVNPPKFELLVNHPGAISQQFRKFIENSIIRELNFYGTQINFKLKGKDKS